MSLRGLARLNAPRPSKYGAKRTVVDGITFHSQAEARRFCELKLLEKAGEIQALVLQPEFPLYAALDLPIHQARDPLKLGVYRGDFSYVLTHNGEVVLEDVKGFATALYKWKKRHVEMQYGIRVQEIRYGAGRRSTGTRGR